MKDYNSKDGTHIRNLLAATLTPRFIKELYKNGCLTAAKSKPIRVCLWCGAPLKNKEESFCSAYCANMWGGEGD